jgi:hypothetical protein
MLSALDSFTGTFANVPRRPYQSVPVPPLDEDRRAVVTEHAVRRINDLLRTRATAHPQDLMSGLEWIRRHGPGTKATLPTQVQASLRSTGLDLTEAQRLVFPDQSDLVPFLVLLILRTGLEPECARELSRSCLSNAAGGWVDIDYTKGRAGSRAYQSIRVPATGHMNAAWLVAKVIELTSDAAQFLHADSLWLTYSPRGSASSTRPSTKDGLLQVGQFGQGNSKYGVIGRFTRDACTFADHEPFDLDLRMLRKTKKRDDYLAAAGRYPDAVENHGSQVAARHYHQIEANREVHLATIESGLGAGLAEATMSPRVVTQSDADKAQEEGIATSQIDALLSGELSLFTNDCLDFHHSPFGAADSDCPVPFWGCLGCSNAVIRAEHLPSVFRFIAHARTQSELLPTESWELLFGAKVRNLLASVLPRFTDDQLRQARLKAGASEPLLFLPAIPAIPENLT